MVPKIYKKVAIKDIYYILYLLYKSNTGNYRMLGRLLELHMFLSDIFSIFFGF